MVKFVISQSQKVLLVLYNFRKHFTPLIFDAQLVLSDERKKYTNALISTLWKKNHKYWKRPLIDNLFSDELYLAYILQMTTDNLFIILFIYFILKKFISVQEIHTSINSVT